MDMKTILKNPSAWLPLAMSCTSLAILLGYIAIWGITRQEDEGIAAHLFQLLMGGQVPIIIFFTLKWVPKNPKPALIILALQCVTALLPLSILYFLEF